MDGALPISCVVDQKAFFDQKAFSKYCYFDATMEEMITQWLSQWLSGQVGVLGRSVLPCSVVPLYTAPIQVQSLSCSPLYK